MMGSCAVSPAVTRTNTAVVPALSRRMEPLAPWMEICFSAPNSRSRHALRAMAIEAALEIDEGRARSARLQVIQDARDRCISRGNHSFTLQKNVVVWH